MESAQADTGVQKSSEQLTTASKHTIHVGEHLKNAVLRLTALLPVTGSVADVLRPILRPPPKSQEVRITNDEFAKAMCEAIKEVQTQQNGSQWLAKIVDALQDVPELWKPKRAAKGTKQDAIKSPQPCVQTPGGLSPTQNGISKMSKKRPGSAPVFGGNSDDPQLAFRHEHGSKERFNDLARRLLGSEMNIRVDATDKQKSQVVWTGIVCLLSMAQKRCSQDKLKDFNDFVSSVLPEGLCALLPGAPQASSSANGRNRPGSLHDGQWCSICGAHHSNCIIQLLSARQQLYQNSIYMSNANAGFLYRA